MKRGIIVVVILLGSLFVSAQKQKWYQMGFRVSTQFTLNKEYTPSVHLSSMRTVHFGGYFRAGKYVYGEIGFGYQYFKHNFYIYDQNEERIEDLVENRYLVIPIRAVGEVKISKKIFFLPYMGISYQPLIKVTENTLGFNKQTFEPHWALLTTGFDMRFGFITLGVDYRYSFQRFFQNEDGKHPQYIGISAGVVF